MARNHSECAEFHNFASGIEEVQVFSMGRGFEVESQLLTSRTLRIYKKDVGELAFDRGYIPQ